MNDAQNTLPKPLSGASRASVLLDLFVIVHVCTAATFAGLMLFAPQFFSYFVIHPEDFSAITVDSIRWVCPFVFGFAGLAGLSLFMPPQVRRQVAILFRWYLRLLFVLDFRCSKRDGGMSIIL